MSPTVRRLSYHGFMLDEFVGTDPGTVSVDMAIYMAGWEMRGAAIASRDIVATPQAVVLTFSDQAMSVDPATSLATHGVPSVALPLGSHYQIQAGVSRVIEMLQHKASNTRLNSVFIDVTCMPKFMAQSIIMELAFCKVVPEIVVGYVSGNYESGSQEPEYDQGLREFIPVNHSLGDGGASVKKACIAALGADERLLRFYFDNETSFDRHFLLASVDSASSSIRDKVERQIRSFANQYQLEDHDIAMASPVSIMEGLRCFDRFVRTAGDCDSVEIFCTGPKTHAVAGCFISLKYRNVRLMGRIPKSYDRKDVDSGGVYCLFRSVDLTDPRVATMAHLRKPLGSDGFNLSANRVERNG